MFESCLEMALKKSKEGCFFFLCFGVLGGVAGVGSDTKIHYQIVPNNGVVNKP